MLLIVAHHYVVNSGLMELISASPFGTNSIFLLIFGAWGKTGINCFVLITGYFMCKSNITLKKFLKLVLEVELYKVIFYLIFLLTGYEPFSWGALKEAILPVSGVSDGFTSCYLLFYLLIPFLNILIRNLNQRQHLLLTGLLLFIYTGLGTMPKISVAMNYVTWFTVLYFVASFLRLYPRQIFERKKIWGFATIGAVLVSVASIFVCALYRNYNEDFAFYYFVADSNKIFAVVTALCAFLFFKNIHFHSRVINVIASAAFGVLMVHANSNAMRRWLWQDTLNNTGYFGSDWLFIHAIVSVLAVYAIATAIDLVRIYLLEKPFFRWYDKQYATWREKRINNHWREA